MEFNKKSFERALKANKIVRYQKDFEAVVKSYLEAENEQCNIANVSHCSLNECKQNIQEFANCFKLIFEDEGECGFGRECVGLTNGNNWVDFNPINLKTKEYIEGFYDKRFYDIAPKDAYHKHNCLAVLGRGENAIRQLSKWVDKLKELGVVVEKYETGAEGIQSMISGVWNYAVRIPNGG